MKTVHNESDISPVNRLKYIASETHNPKTDIYMKILGYEEVIKRRGIK